MSKKEKVLRKKVLRKALKNYFEREFSLIPIKPGDKVPDLSSWNKYQNQRLSESYLSEHFKANPDCNIGIVTGKISGIVVVDLDSLEALEFAKKNGFPDTPTVKTARGYHYYYAHPGNRTVRNATNLLGVRGLDLRGDGGIVVAPPSIHQSGHQYEWVKGKSLDDLPLAPLPQILLTKDKSDKKSLKELEEGVNEGRRNTALIGLVGSWAGKGRSLKYCKEKALEWNKTCKPPEDEDKVIASVKSIWKKEQAKRKPLYTPEEKKQALKLLKSKNLLKKHLELCRNDYIGRNRELTLVKLATLTRHLNQGVSIVVTGPSSVGKSQLIKTVLKTVWAGDRYEYTSITPKFLDYLKKQSLENHVLYIQEAKGLEGAEEAFKLAVSEGELNVGKLGSSNKTGYKAINIKKSTKGLVMLTTTTGESFSIGHELDTRILKIELEHSDALVKSILLHKGKMVQNGHTGPNGNDPPEHPNSRASTKSGSPVHKNVKDDYRIFEVADKLIQSKDVYIPFGKKLAKLFPHNDGRFARDYDKVINLIKASALFHQFQREIDSGGRIIATMYDYKIVYRLRHLFHNFRLHVPERLKPYIDAIKTLSKKGGYPTRKDICQELDKSSSSMKRYRTEALNKKLITIVEGTGKNEKIKLLKPTLLPSLKKLFNQ